MNQFPVWWHGKVGVRRCGKSLRLPALTQDSTQHPTTACADGLGTKPGTVLFTTPAQPTIGGATQWDLSSDAIDCTRLKVPADSV